MKYYNEKLNNLAKFLFIINFVYKNTKNTNIIHLILKFYYKYYFSIFTLN